MDKVPQVLVDQEMARLMEEYPVMQMGLTPFAWVSVLGLLQLALRHPAIGDENKYLGNLAGAKIQAMLAEASDFIGQMVETGWHPELDEARTIPVASIPSDDHMRVGFIELSGDGESIFDVSYDLPVDPDDSRWKWEAFMYGVGDKIFICNVFWDVNFSVNQVYRLCLGLKEQMEPLSMRGLEWLAAQNG